MTVSSQALPLVGGRRLSVEKRERTQPGALRASFPGHHRDSSSARRAPDRCVVLADGPVTLGPALRAASEPVGRVARAWACTLAPTNGAVTPERGRAGAQRSPWWTPAVTSVSELAVHASCRRAVVPRSPRRPS